MTSAERLSLIDCRGVDLPLTTQAELLGLSRSRLYYVPVGPSPEEVLLKRRIDEIYTAWPFYGVRRITAQLKREGVVANHKAVARHMGAMGICGDHPGAQSKQTSPKPSGLPLSAAPRQGRSS